MAELPEKKVEANIETLYKVSPIPGAASKYECHRAHEKDVKLMAYPIPYPPLKGEEAIKAVLNRLKELANERRSVRMFMEICVRCGACIKQCHYYLGTQDPNNTPVGRAELLRKIYRKYFSIGGKIFGKLAGAEELTEKILDEEWYKYFYQCSECRRCSMFCPFGIDTAEVTMAVREALASAGLVTKYVTEVIAKVYIYGNNLGIPPKAFVDSLEFFAADVQDMEGITLKVPVVINKELYEEFAQRILSKAPERKEEIDRVLQEIDTVKSGTYEFVEIKDKADVLYIPPSADLFTNIDTTIGVIKVFNAVAKSRNLNWAFSPFASEAAVFGLFLDYMDIKEIQRRVVMQAQKMGAKYVIFGECGHAWRAYYNCMEAFHGPLPFKFMNIIEFTRDFIERGVIKLDKSKNAETIVTLHDPCNYARASPKIIYDARFVIKSAVEKFHEMREDTIKEKTFCCGGGGGLLTEELMELRMLGAKPRASAVIEVVEKYGVNYLATWCAIDKAQLPLVVKYYEIKDKKTGELITVGGIHDLVGKAIVFEK